MSKAYWKNKERKKKDIHNVAPSLWNIRDSFASCYERLIKGDFVRMCKFISIV